MTPAENDLKLAELMRQRDEVLRQIQRLDSLISSAEVYQSSYYESKIAERQREREDQAQENYRLLVEMTPYQDNYSREQWSRYYLVTNGNGHVHTSMICSTCYVTTQYAWLPDCSGMTEEELVEEFGERVCTVCCPSAPVTPGLVGRRDREAQGAKAQEKAEKQAAKLEKALLPDGSELRLSDARPKTLIAGQRELLHLMNNLGWYGDTHPSAENWRNDIELLLIAISNKTGEDLETIRATAQIKTNKKLKKERGY